MKKGFTLIEVLIVICIIALLFTLLVSTVAGQDQNPVYEPHESYQSESYDYTENEKEIITVNDKRYQLID